MIRSIILCVVLTAGLVACGKKEKPADVVLNAKSTAPEPVSVNGMPALTIEKTDGSKVSLQEQTGKVLLICFNPDCDHCQREAKLLSENKDILTGYQVYFISPEKMDLIVKFSKEYNLVEPNLHFGRAEGVDVINAVGQISTVPTFFVYNDQKLVKRVEGETSLATLKEILK